MSQNRVIKLLQRNRNKFREQDASSRFTPFIDPYSPIERQLLSNLHRLLNDNKAIPTAIQRFSFPYIFNTTHDVLIRAEFGSGKTIAYAFPIIIEVIRAIDQAKTCEGKEALYALIVVPSQDLCDQVWKVFNTLCRDTGVTIHLSHQNIKLATINAQSKKSGVNIMIFEHHHVNHYFLESEDAWDMSYLRFVVLDEAPLLLNIPRYAKSKNTDACFYKYREPLDQFFVFKHYEFRMIVVASYPDIIEYPNFDDRPNGCLKINLGELSFSRLSISMDYEMVTGLKFRERLDSLFGHVEQLLARYSSMRLIIFANDSSVFVIKDGLNAAFEEAVAVAVNEMLLGPARMNAVNEFKSHVANILVTTDMLAPGMDFGKVDCVIQFELPSTLDMFFHRCARCGRLGNMGTVYYFFDTDTDTELAEQLVDFSLKQKDFDIPEQIKRIGNNSWAMKKFSSTL